MPTFFPSRYDGTHLAGEAVYCRLDGHGCFNEFSPAWYSLCEKFELRDFAPDRHLGRPAWDLLSADWRLETRDRLNAWIRGELPSQRPVSSHIDSHIWQAWAPWPILKSPGSSPGGAGADSAAGNGSGPVGLQLTLDPTAQARLPFTLVDPIFRGAPDGDGRLGSVNAASRRLLAERPELTQSQLLQGWLGRQPQARRIVRVTGLDLDGDAIWITAPPHLHSSSGFRLLGKLMRTLLHDLSNPLSAVRMLAEVVSRGSRHYSDPTKVLPDMIRHLDLATSTMRRLRTLVQVTSSIQALDTLATFDDAVRMLRTELDRREVTVDLSGLIAPEPELEGHTDALLLLALGAVLLTLGRSGEGDSLRLAARVTDAGSWRLQGSLKDSGSPRPWFADPEIGIDAIERLLSPFRGRLLRLDLGGDPMWELELPL